MRSWEPPSLKPLLEIKTPSAVQAVEGEDQDHGPGHGPDPGADFGASRPADEVADDVAGDEAGDEAGGPGARQAALARGNLVHALLEQATRTGVMPPGEGEAHAEAAGVFADPRLEWVFHPARAQGRGLSEAPFIQRLPRPDGGEQRVTGTIDRLVVHPDRVDIIDYKTNRVGTDTSRLAGLVQHYKPQLASYAQAVAGMYPGRTVRAWLLFTDPRLGPEQRLQEVALT